MMNLDEINEMWEKDSVIDPDNLHEESLKIPQLHSKYYTIYNTITLLREKAKETYNKVRLDRYNYYTGKASAEVYAEEPFPYKIRDKDALQRHMDADERLNKVELKVKYYDVMLKFLEEIIRMITNRNYSIKNSIDFMKFTAGYN
jgi:tRNA U34 5-carboxymethylaminomethyl modifying enzyme MnmG/GidA